MIAPVGIGETIAGKYEVERFLAKGGMGMVVVARHLQLDKQVAIKFMLPHLLHAGVEPGALERFVREGRAAVRLRGENVARVLDVDTLPSGMPYMVMEYLEGQDLSHHIQKHGPLPLAESVDYVLQACVAMAEAHLCGIVHRDLKPSNLFVARRPDGSALIKVLDFGISKLYQDPDGERTQTAVTMGSPSYMAPEQAQSARDADVRSDIWSMGVILYECTSRQLPYGKQASTAGVLAQLIYEDPRPLAEVAPNLPAAFCQVVNTCLSKDPAGRYQSIGELASALLPFASAVGRQAAASVHAIIGGAASGATPAGSSAPGAPLGPAHVADAGPASRARKDDPAYHADTDLAPVPPAMTRRGVSVARGGEAAVLALDADAIAGTTPLELAVDPHDPEVRREATPQKPVPEAALLASGRTWRRKVRGRVPLVTAVLLPLLTLMVLFTEGGWMWLDAMNASATRIGHALAHSLDREWQSLAGPAFQLAIPLALALLFSLLRWPLLAAECWWLLGAGVAYLGWTMREAPWQRVSPITGDLDPWSHWFVVWNVEDHAGTIAQVVYWSGAALMVAAILLTFRHSRRSVWD